MSYMRPGHPLKYFKSGTTDSYVYPSSIKDVGVEDYSDSYEDNKSFCELIGNFVRRSTGDEEFAWKIVQILAEKLGIEDDLREEPATTKELLERDTPSD